MPDGELRDGSGVAALAARLLGLGREMDSLRRLVQGHDRTVTGRLADLEAHIGQLATTVAGLSEQVAELVGGGNQESDAHRSWFDTTDPTQARTDLVDLVRWLDRVYLRFPDAVLPPCWIWHPSVVEELRWLRRSWTEAFTGRPAAVFRVADWHDRQRPGVVGRIRALNDGVCSLDQHAPGAEQDRRPTTTPAVDAVPAIADWWTARPGERPPHPSEAGLADGVYGHR